MTAGFPDGARRLETQQARLAARALEVALTLDPTMRERYDELGLRRLLNDAAVHIGEVALALASNDPGHASRWAEMASPVYRRRRVSMDDLVTLCEGVRRSIAAVLSPDERVVAERALDEASGRYHALRRLGGDTRRRNRILAAIYKGG